MIQTLTPRLAYNYTSKKDQSNLPIFDSETKSDSYEGLFSGQKFTGIDRISNANDIIIGFESEFIDSNTGETYFTLKTGQAFYNDDQVVSNDISVPFKTRRKYSNILTSAQYSLKDLSFNGSIQYNPQTNTLSNLNSSADISLLLLWRAKVKNFLGLDQ